MPLPEPLREALADPAADAALLLASIDDAGLPHPCLLTPAMVRPAGEMLRVAVHGSSRSAANLRARPQATLAYTDPGDVIYVKARVVQARSGPFDLVTFVLEIVDAWRDVPRAGEAAALRSGLRFAPADPAAWRRDAVALARAIEEA